MSYWIPIFVPPRFKVSTKGTDWLVLGLVAVHAGTSMYRNSFLQATLGTRFGSSVDEGSFALVVLPMGLSTCEAEMIVGDQFDDLRLTQLTGAARSGEREMVVLKSHGCTYGAGPRRTKSLEVRRQRRLRFRSGDFLSDYIDPYI